jgi:hypothetical protein
MIALHSEVVRVLERERLVCDRAMERLREESHVFETQYGWSTGVFQKKFDSGEIADDQSFFRWYALAEALKDWQQIRDELNAVISAAENQHA